MTENKYLSDGRKVAIISKLNSTEYIVQEIFVTASGDEIPSGESFTTKSVHDRPVKSYREKEEERLKAHADSLKLEIERLRKEVEKNKDKLKANAEMLANSPQINDLFGKKAELLSKFMTGTVEYLVLEGYGIKPPVKMEDAIEVFEGYGYGGNRFQGLKLASVLGKSNGDLAFAINRYSDGSGGSEIVHPFATLQDALVKVKELALISLEKKRLSRDEFQLLKKLGIKFSDEEKERLLVHFLSRFDSSVKQAHDNVDKYMAQIKTLAKEAEEFKSEVLKC